MLNSSSDNALINYLSQQENPVRDMASFANTLYWFGFCLFRFIAIVQAQFMSARTMLLLNLGGCLFGNAMLLVSRDVTVSIIAIFVFGAALGMIAILKQLY